MKITVAVDSFKGSLNSMQAGNAVKAGILRVFADADVCVLPVADGGEGTVDALIQGVGGQTVKLKVKGPLSEDVDASYGIINSPDGKDMTAVIEMASASGLTKIPVEKRNPLHTTTFGVGQLILDAIEKGCRKFIVGIGGSATNDGGTGMLQALGYSFKDKNGNEIRPGALGLKDLVCIDDRGAVKELSSCFFTVACDVNNPLCGPNGCSYIYGPQKGADEKMVKDMDEYLSNYALAAKKYSKDADQNYPGAGAAGGLGFAFLTFLKAALKPGIDIVLDAVCLEKHIKESDIAVTGEGRIDSQTAMGKAPAGVALLAKKYGLKTIAFCGCASIDSRQCNQHGIDAIFPIIRRPDSLEKLMDTDTASMNLTDTAEQVFRLLMN